MVAPRWPTFTLLGCSAIAATFSPRVLFCSINQHDPKNTLNLVAQISIALQHLYKVMEFKMFAVERLADRGWAREAHFKTEFKAFINARSQCMATGETYRVISSYREVAYVIKRDGLIDGFG